MEGLYLAEPHGSLTYSGRKSAVAKNKSHPGLVGTHILVSGGHADGKAYGEVTVAEELELTRDEFKARFDEHRISTKELERWWPEDETLFLYSFTFAPYEKPLPVEVPPGVQTLMGEVKFKELEEGTKMPQPGKNESQDDFVSRCIPVVLKDKTAKDQKQAIAICFQTWRDAKKKAKKQEVGGPEKCACPKCDYTTEKERGTPCRSQKCPECGATLVADVGEKAGRRVRSSKTQVIRDIIAKLKEVLSWANYEDEDEIKSAVKLYEYEGKTYIVTWTTNSFIDRDGEIFTDKSIKEYIARHKGDEVKGELKYRHIDGSKFGDIIYQAMSGRFLVEASVFNDNAVGQAFKQLFKQYPGGHPTVSPEGWGCSHGYLYEGVDREDGVYEWFEKKETSVLPASVASNPHNPSLEVYEMDAKSKDELTAIVGEEVSDQIAATGEALTKKKEDEGIANKETEAPAEIEAETEVTEEPKAEEPVVEPIEEPEAKPEEEEDEVPALVGKEMVKAISEAVAAQFDIDSLSTAFKSLTNQLATVNQKVDAVVTRLTEVERSDEERLAEKELQLPRFPWSSFTPSQAEATKVKDGDPIKAKVPIEAPPAIQFLAEQVTK